MITYIAYRKSLLKVRMGVMFLMSVSLVTRNIVSYSPGIDYLALILLIATSFFNTTLTHKV